MNISSSRNRAFSLLELIAVILIIGIVAAFVTPAASTILRGSQLTQASQIVTDQISLARQLALTKNCMVEVRLIRFADPEMPGEVDPSGASDPTKGAYRAIQCFEVLDSGAAVPMDKPQLLPQAIIMNPDSFSTLIKGATSATTIPAKKQPDSNKDPELPRNIKHAYDFVTFRFLPDGSTNLDPLKKDWCFTLHNINDKPKGTTLPANFFTLQIDAVSGTIKSYRPGV